VSTDNAVISRPLRADAQRNYDHILEVARQAFIENGTATPLDDIASRAGVGPGTLYRHFPTRDSLILAALDGSMRELVVVGDRLAAADDSFVALREWLIAIVTHFGTYGGLSEAVARATRAGGSPLSASCNHIENRTCELVARAVEAGAVRGGVSGTDVFAIANSLAGTLSLGHYGIDDAERLVDLFVGGLH